MSEAPTPEQARQWLTEQVERLAKIRNASTRDPAFNQWRQNALTVVQRIWPDEPAKWQRFRRIPFSPAGALTDERSVRSAYDRGCVEVSRLLKRWIGEIDLLGVQGASDDPSLTTEAESPGPGTAPGGEGKQSLLSMLGLDDLSKLTDPSQAAPGAAAPPPAAKAPPVAPARPAAPARPVEPAAPPRATPSPPAPTGGASAIASPQPSPALAVAMLAAELERLNVPAGDRERIRSVLLDLARRLESGDLPWNTLQEAVTQVMAFPDLGRQVLPVLTPYLKNAA